MVRDTIVPTTTRRGFLPVDHFPDLWVVIDSGNNPTWYVSRAGAVAAFRMGGMLLVPPRDQQQ